MRSFRTVDRRSPIYNADGFVATFDGRPWSVEQEHAALETPPRWRTTGWWDVSATDHWIATAQIPCAVAIFRRTRSYLEGLSDLPMDAPFPAVRFGASGRGKFDLSGRSGSRDTCACWMDGICFISLTISTAIFRSSTSSDSAVAFAIAPYARRTVCPVLERPHVRVCLASRSGVACWRSVRGISRPHWRSELDLEEPLIDEIEIEG